MCVQNRNNWYRGKNNNQLQKIWSKNIWSMLLFVRIHIFIVSISLSLYNKRINLCVNQILQHTEVRHVMEEEEVFPSLTFSTLPEKHQNRLHWHCFWQATGNSTLSEVSSHYKEFSEAMCCIHAKKLVYRVLFKNPLLSDLDLPESFVNTDH